MFTKSWASRVRTFMKLFRCSAASLGALSIRRLLFPGDQQSNWPSPWESWPRLRPSPSCCSNSSLQHNNGSGYVTTTDSNRGPVFSHCFLSWPLDHNWKLGGSFLRKSTCIASEPLNFSHNYQSTDFLMNLELLISCLFWRLSLGCTRNWNWMHQTLFLWQR